MEDLWESAANMVGEIEDQMNEEHVDELDKQRIDIEIPTRYDNHHSRALKCFLYSHISTLVYLPEKTSRAVTLQFLKGIADNKIIALPKDVEKLSCSMKMKLPRTVLCSLVTYIYTSNGGMLGLGISCTRPPDKKYLVRLLRYLSPNFIGLNMSVKQINNPEDISHLVKVMLGSVYVQAGEQIVKKVEVRAVLAYVANYVLPAESLKEVLKSLVRLNINLSRLSLLKQQVHNEGLVLGSLFGLNLDNFDCSYLGCMIQAIISAKVKIVLN